MRRRAIKRRLVVGATLLLGGCNTILQRPPAVQTVNWPLNVQRPHALPPRRHGKVLLVRDIGTAPGLEQQGVQWLLPNGSVHVDFYNQWVVPPAAAVTNDLRQWLAGSGMFAAVVGPGAVSAPDYTLEGTLLTFIGEPRTLTARAALTITLLNVGHASRAVLLQRTLQAVAPLPQDTPAGVAAGLRSALAQLLAETEAAVTGVTIGSGARV
jgi:cholesterol transport system auxiliary component